MQSARGGWGAFDKDNDKTIMTKIPFCDFGEALDPPSVDVTAHVVEAFGKLGISREHPTMVRALALFSREQETDGAWFGRWGVNYVYGTAAVAAGAGGHRRGYVCSPISRAPATGWSPISSRMAAGAKAAPPTWTSRWSDAASRRPRRPPGR